MQDARPARRARSRRSVVYSVCTACGHSSGILTHSTCAIWLGRGRIRSETPNAEAGQLPQQEEADQGAGGQQALARARGPGGGAHAAILSAGAAIGAWDGAEAAAGGRRRRRCAPRRCACAAAAPASRTRARSWSPACAAGRSRTSRVFEDAAGPRGHHADAVGQVRGLAQVVGHEQHRGPLVDPELLHDVPQLFARELVERAEGLVEQQQLRVVDQRAAQRRALQHAARQLPRPLVAEALEPHLREQRLGAFGVLAVLLLARSAGGRARRSSAGSSRSRGS